MRAFVALALLLMTSPVYAQSIGSSSGATAIINSSDPPSTESRVTTAPTVVAPGLTAAGVETCLGSAAGGISLMGGGLTFGATHVDEGCTIRLLSRQLYAFGFQKAALALMCEDEHVVAAMEAVGSSCPRAPRQVGVSYRISALALQDEDASAVGSFALPVRDAENERPRKNVVQYADASADHAVSESSNSRPMPDAEGAAGKDGTNQFLNARGLY